MCGISGFYQPFYNYTEKMEYSKSILSRMAKTLRHRGPDDEGLWLSPHAGLSHARLSVIDLATGHQPMIRSREGKEYAIAYNGELYNTKELRNELIRLGYSFETTSDTEVILTSYLEYGPDFVSRLNGIFAFAIADPVKDALLLFRDRVGVKPLFYTKKEEELVFSSELKGLFSFPGISPVLDRQGLNEIFSLGPARTPGSGVFKDIHELLPGHFLTVSASGLSLHCYWRLESRPHTDSFEDTVEKTAFLVTDAVKRQMVSDVPICTFLSGGVDSSLVSAICARELKKEGATLTTFSFDFTDNDKYFKSNSFQPSQDRPYVDQMKEFLGSSHHYLECDSRIQADRLTDSVLAHDLPAMGDIDSSILHFCSMVKEHCKVALTGECADEIFGGYPWFHREACLKAHTFPWTMDLSARQVLLKDSFIQALDMEDYVKNAYEASIASTPRLDGENGTEARRREIAWLNLNWFMQTLLNRMDRASMYSGLEARVPFADHRIIEYLWNVPWEMKAAGRVPKGLLRKAAEGLLPREILYRPKSPYPKTYDTRYEALLSQHVKELLHDSASPVMEFLDKEKTETFLSNPSDYGKPWYGQLMAGPQLLAYILQIDFWLRTYHIQIL